MTNYYPEYPILPYQKTVVEMDEVIKALNDNSAAKLEKVAAYVMIRNEGGNGQHGNQNNYIGAQADSGRWNSDLDRYIAGVTVKQENPQNGKPGLVRYFLAFYDISGCIAFLLDRVQGRGLYVGGFAHPHANFKVNNVNDWIKAYYQEWVHGKNDEPPSETLKQNLLSMYNAGLTRIK